MPKGIYIHPFHKEAQKRKIGLTVSNNWKTQRVGKTYEEIFGIEKAQAMCEKQRLAKLGRKMPWNSKLGLRGIQTPRWIKDRSQIKRQEDRGNPLHKQWSMAVKNRDGWKCKIADNNCVGKVVAHHILTWKNYPELRFNVNNGITLCHAHHPRRRAEEKRLEPVFQALIATASE